MSAPKWARRWNLDCTMCTYYLVEKVIWYPSRVQLVIALQGMCLLLAIPSKYAVESYDHCHSLLRKLAPSTYVFGLLHALVRLCPSHFHSLPRGETDWIEAEEELLPITSYACIWKPPRKRKGSTAVAYEASFQKYVYSQEKKHFLMPLEDYDPRPLEYRGTAKGKCSGFFFFTESAWQGALRVTVVGQRESVLDWR